jgi:hypothetical protein
MGVTINCGNFESVRVDAGIEQDLEKGETVEGAYAVAWAKIHRQVEKRAKQAAEELMGVKEPIRQQ